MKKIITLLVISLISAITFAQVPQKMSYQGVVRDASDILVANTMVGMQISILEGSSTGTPVYVETQTPTSNSNGLVSIEVGAGTVVSGDFSTIDWANDSFYIKTETDPTGGTSYSITGTSQLLSVPYALHANTTGGSGNTLDEAYNAETSGSPSTRTIAADDGKIAIVGSGNDALEITSDGTNLGLNVISSGGAGDAIEITNDGAGEAISIANDGVGDGIQIDNDSVGDAINIDNTDSPGDGLEVDNNTGGNGITISNDGGGDGISVDNAGAGDGIFVDNLDGAGGIAVNVSNAGGGNALDILNDGGGHSIQLLNDGGGDAINITNDGAGGGVLIDNDGAGKALFIDNKDNTDAEIALAIENDSGGDAAFILNDGLGDAINIINEGFGRAINVDNDSNGIALNIDNLDNGGGRDAIRIRNDGGGRSIDIGNSGDADAVFISNEEDGNAIAINNTASTGGHSIAINNGGGGKGILVVNGDSGIAVDIENSSTEKALNVFNGDPMNVSEAVKVTQVGTGTAVSIENAGSGKGLHVLNGDPTNADLTILGTTGGLGTVALLTTDDNNANMSSTLIANNIGSGSAAEFITSDEAAGKTNSAATVNIVSDGLGAGLNINIVNANAPGADANLEPVIFASHEGFGQIGHFETINTSNVENTVEIINKGLGLGLHIDVFDNPGTIPGDALYVEQGNSSTIAAAGRTAVFDLHPTTSSVDAAVLIRSGVTTFGHAALRVLAADPTKKAAVFSGDVDITSDLTIGGTMTAAVKAFKIDHPLDPENKYLIHNSIESNERINIYSGNITTDEEGYAVVQLPEYMSALNTNFKYQLTIVDKSFARAVIWEPMNTKDNTFVIKTDMSNIMVSWQMTGTRQDTWSLENPLEVEVDKNNGF